MCPAEKFAAAYPFRPLSIAPEPSPWKTPQTRNIHQIGAAANPRALLATNPVLPARSSPIPNICTARPEKKLDRK